MNIINQLEAILAGYTIMYISGVPPCRSSLKLVNHRRHEAIGVQRTYVLDMLLAFVKVTVLLIVFR